MYRRPLIVTSSFIADSNLSLLWPTDAHADKQCKHKNKIDILSDWIRTTNLHVTSKVAIVFTFEQKVG